MFTDKLVAKIPSTASGVVKHIHFQNDTICAVGHTVMTIETGDDAQPNETPSKIASSPSSSESAESSDSSDDEVDKSKDDVISYALQL